MIVTYLRSSSYNCYDMCEFQYCLSYDLNIPSHSNVAAEKGNVVHKAMELLAKKKLLMQNGTNENVTDEEIGFNATQEESTPDNILEASFKHHKEISVFSWVDKDYNECKKWFFDALSFGGGIYNPMNQKIVCPESRFDFEIRKPWATYSYSDGSNGWLRLKGTIDLVIENHDGSYEMVDYKTGARKNWVTGEEKTYYKLQKDPQLLIYYYAARRIYPEIKKWCVTIYFIKDGGPFTLAFGDEEYELAERILQKRFYQIKNNHKPRPVYPNWKCTKFCWYGKRDENGNPVEYKDSICNKTRQELLTLGLDKLESKYRVGKDNESYTGGGRKNVATTN